jgi:uncharacterized membrane protein YdfJ with MMPL/SSD domain
MTRWTDVVIAHRRLILSGWLIAFVLGGFAAANLGGLLSNRFSVPGAESERGLDLLKDHMRDRSDGAFTLVATGVDSPADRAAVAAAVARGAKAADGKAAPLLPAARGVVYAQSATPLENEDASELTPILVPATMKLLGRWNWYLPERVRRALRLRPSAQRPAPAGAER